MFPFRNIFSDMAMWTSLFRTPSSTYIFSMHGSHFTVFFCITGLGLAGKYVHTIKSNFIGKTVDKKERFVIYRHSWQYNSMDDTGWNQCWSLSFPSFFVIHRENYIKTGFVTRWVHLKIFENTNWITMVVKSVSEIIYNTNAPDVSVALAKISAYRTKREPKSGQPWWTPLSSLNEKLRCESIVNKTAGAIVI